eukprot:scaffold29925_cov36-Prasinocladus_malaysianus.AAC.2
MQLSRSAIVRMIKAACNCGAESRRDDAASITLYNVDVDVGTISTSPGERNKSSSTHNDAIGKQLETRHLVLGITCGVYSI